MTKLKWTKESPTEGGYYWLKGASYELIPTSIVYVGNGCAWFAGTNWNLPLPLEDAEWLGPLDAPPDNAKVAVTRQKLVDKATDVIDLVMRKNADYGDAWQRQGGCGWALRLADKLCRIETLADGREALVLDEAIEDTLKDAIGYALLGLLWLDKRKAKPLKGNNVHVNTPPKLTHIGVEHA